MNLSHPLALLGLLVLVPLLWKGRRRPATLLRGLALVLLLLALAGPQVISRIHENYIYFALDLSGSISQPREELFKLIDSLMVEREHVHYGLILFGAEAALDQGFAPKLDLGRVSTVVPPEGTDIAAALKLALAGFPKEGGKEIVLLSDGRPTQGGLREQLARAASEGVRISVLPLYPRGTEAWLEEFSLPQEVPEGAEFPVKLSIGALGAMEARLLLYRDERLLQAVELPLKKGENGFTLHDRLQGAGVHRYRAYLLADRDAILENNRLEAAVIVAGGPEVLLLQEGEGEALAGLLEAAGYSFQRAAPADLPWEPSALAPYRLVILDDVRLAELSDRAAVALEGYVEGGGGLLLIQGRRAVEGLRKTELEKILPVSYEGREPAQAPSLAIAFVLDRSSSMTGRKIQFLKEAAAASVEILDEKNLIGICAFDTAYEWIVPLGPAADKEGIYRQIAEIEANGGTDLLPALTEAFHRLNGVEAKLKHIVVFSDGKTGDKLKFPELVEGIRKDEITLSAIAIGETADTEFLG
ncbi:MAG: VWA domain-containing protein [Candidatus Bipolaricaulia bacterium]